MEAKDIAALLTGYGFKGLSLFKKEETNTTFKYESFDTKKAKTLERTVTANGKVEVYQLPEVGKFGVSPSNSMVRFIGTGKVSQRVKTDTSHLAGTKVPPALSMAFEKAKVNPVVQRAFMKKLWHYFNTEKFGGRMTEPKLVVSTKSPGISSARGVYSAGRAFSAGQIWMAEFMFNAREAFFLEVFLHEMCHQATWELDKHVPPRPDKDKGHGKNWQHWMTKVGLDPRRFDPTDDTEYQSTGDNITKEAELTEQFGKRVDPSYFAHLRPVPASFADGTAVVAKYKGRALSGSIHKVGRKVSFTYWNPKKQRNTLQWKSWPADTFYLPKD